MNKTKDPATWSQSELLQEVYRLGGLYEDEQCDSEFWKGRAAAFEVMAGKLRAFAHDIMRAWPVGDVDGGELQEAALRHGLLAPAEPTQEERDENGLCDGDDWYRPTDLLSPNAEISGTSPKGECPS